jgi:hypothetical protein
MVWLGSSRTYRWRVRRERALRGVTGYASIAFPVRYLTTHTIGVFGARRVALGAAVPVLVGAQAIS